VGKAKAEAKQDSKKAKIDLPDDSNATKTYSKDEVDAKVKIAANDAAMKAVKDIAKNQAKEKKALDGVKKAIKVKTPKSDDDGVTEALKVTKEIKSAVLKGEAKKAEHEMNAAMAKAKKPKESFIDALEAMAK
jgi:hypothetical protein